MVTTFDLIAATQRLVTRLQELGMIGWSQKLAEALDAASTGGELVMAVRWHLRELERSGEELPEDVRHQVRMIVQEINSTGW
ncbi:MAG TPA: hypothetical protein VE964_07265 [Myxococcales bacterium]|nr:hypothetical protein [Myxococcales bacterium]